MKLEYIRTDKNGTKIYHDWTCPRCGGAGEAQKWEYTGRVCYACGGTGKRVKPLIVKEYTDEYRDKLDARRAARQAKYEADHADEIAEAKAERDKRDAEWQAQNTQRAFADWGLGADGVGYILRGNTYPAKESIKAAGGRWRYGVWVCPVAVQASGVTATRVDMSAHAGKANVSCLVGDGILDAISEVKVKAEPMGYRLKRI